MPSLNNTDQPNRRIAFFTTIWTVATLILIGVTWKLWTGTSEFPQVPLLEPLISAPLFVDWIALAALVLSTFWLLIRSVFTAAGRPNLSHNTAGRFGGQLAEYIFILAIIGLFLLNQHRLQPWAWQFFLYAALAAVLRKPKDIIFSARWLTASIYFYSSISKFDYQFINGLGGRLAQTLTQTIGLDSVEGINVIAFAMPIFELSIAAALLIPKTRKLGVVMAAVFHGSLIATLGPWGLNHHLGVLVWNFFFFLVTASLFWPTVTQQQTDEQTKRQLLPLIITVALVAYPILPREDHWLAWGLYSPNNSRCDLEVIQENDEGEFVFERFDLGGLSLRQLNVPLYPEARFQLGVAQAIKQQENLRRSKIFIRSKSDRFTGERESTAVEDSGQWGRKNDLFFFNSKARTFKASN